jgi:hypothetical protein
MHKILSALFVLSVRSLSQESDAPPDNTRHLITRYDGTIGKDLGITLILTREQTDDGEGLWSGTYHYHKTGLPIHLSETPGADETITFRENESVDAEGNDTYTGLWTVKVQDDEIEGSWASKDGKKKLPIVLKESYPFGSVRTPVTSVAFSHIERRNDSRRGRELHYLQVTGDSPALRKVNDILRRYAHEAFREITDEEVNQGAPKKPTGPAPTAKQIEEAVLADADLPDDEEGIEAVYSQIEKSDVVMNENGFLTIEHHTWSYEGGAHGNYANGYTSFDLETGEELTLTDLVKPGYEQRWAALGAAEIKAAMHVKPDAPLTEAGLFEDKLEITDNWYLTPGGIGFCYNPYEIASYAQGAVSFVLPWNSIAQDLKPGTRVADLANAIIARSAKPPAGK